jgi:hypothetical protein
VPRALEDFRTLVVEQPVVELELVDGIGFLRVADITPERVHSLR